MRFLLPAILLVVAAPLSSQEVAVPGFALTLEPNPSASPLAISTTLSNGDIVVFDGNQVVQYLADGSPFRTLGSLPQFAFPSFVLVDPDELRVFVGESSSGSIYKLFVGVSSGPDLVATLPLNYDAAMFEATQLFVSAATCGFGCGNEIWRVELGSNQTTLVVRTPGPSGPIVFDSTGSLFYGSVSPLFPPPPASSAVWRWSAAQLAGPLPLDLAQAQQIGEGFSGAARLAHDPRTGWLYLAENNFATGENRIVRVKSSAAESPVLVEGRPFRSIGNLTLHPGVEDAHFRAFQPASGGTLTYSSSDFSVAPERFAVRPQRPTVALLGPGVHGPGNFALEMSGGPPGGFVSLWFCPQASFHPTEEAFIVGRLPLFLGLDPATLSSRPGFLSLDASGALHQDYTNPGGWEGTLAMQLLLLDSAQRLMGSTSPAFL